MVSIVKELLGFLTNSLIIEDLRVGPVGVLASDLPGLEEWVPIDVGDQRLQIVVFKHFSSQKSRLDYLYFAPVSFHLSLSCFGKGYKTLILLTFIVFSSDFIIFISDILDIFSTVILIQQTIDDNHSSTSI